MQCLLYFLWEVATVPLELRYTISQAQYLQKTETNGKLVGASARMTWMSNYVIKYSGGTCNSQ